MRILFRKMRNFRKSSPYNGKISGSLLTFRKEAAVFSPGVLLLLFGLAVFIAPRFFLGILAAFFVLLGVLFCVIAWKFRALRKKFEKMSKDFQGRIFVQGMNFSDNTVEIYEDDAEHDSSKKITYH